MFFDPKTSNGTFSSVACCQRYSHAISHPVDVAEIELGGHGEIAGVQ
jgi:hypothetical protein